MAGVGVGLLVFRPVRLGVCLNPGRLGLELAPPVVPRTGIVLFSSGLVWSTGLLERTVRTVRIVYKNISLSPPQLTLTARTRLEDGGHTRERLSGPTLGFVTELVQDLLGYFIRLLLHHLVQDLQLPLLQQLQLLLVPDDLPVVPPG